MLWDSMECGMTGSPESHWILELGVTWPVHGTGCALGRRRRRAPEVQAPALSPHPFLVGGSMGKAGWGKGGKSGGR